MRITARQDQRIIEAGREVLIKSASLELSNDELVAFKAALGINKERLNKEDKRRIIDMATMMIEGTVQEIYGKITFLYDGPTKHFDYCIIETVQVGPVKVRKRRVQTASA